MKLALQDVLAINDKLSEYRYFEAEPEGRDSQEQLFLSDKTWVPHYEYPNLRNFLRQGELFDGQSYTDMKTHALAAIETLWAAKNSGEIPANQAQLFIDFYEMRIRRLLLLKTAQEMAEPNYASMLPTLQYRFMRLNTALYGSMDNARWLSVIASERQRLTETNAQDLATQEIHSKLAEFYDGVPAAEIEGEVFDKALRDVFQPFIQQRYEHILRVVPSTGDSLVYDANQCAAIMKHALAVGGFHGWTVGLDPAKTSPSTDVVHKIIALPSNTSRTANQLKRLILHEQEVHARRGLNALQHPEVSVLQGGTAQYAAVEEGLGLFLETMLQGSTNSSAVHRARDRYITAGLALGIGTTVRRDARQTYEVLWRIIAVRLASGGAISESIATEAQNQAYSHVENAFRGTNFSSRGVIYLKLKIYYEGFLQNIAYMRSIAGNLDRFEEVFIGKYNHTDSLERALILDLIQNASPQYSPKASAAIPEPAYL